MRVPAFAFILPVFIGFSACFNVKSNARFQYEKLEPADYAKHLSDSSDYYLIDVRTVKEHQKSRLAGARNYNFLAFHFGRDVDTLDRDKLAFLYCYTCHRSPFAARIMKHKGFRHVYDLKGGFQAWEKAGMAIEAAR